MASDTVPKLSVLVLGFNQESYIRNAVQSAFNQTADSLEIVLSDDASADNTYDIMERMAAEYQGPHKVLCRRNRVNQGTNSHLNTLIELAASDRIMCIAGDDVALPNRASRVIATFDSEKAWLVHSDAEAIDSAGQVVRQRGFDTATLRGPYDILDAARSQGLYLGATVAFHKDLFRKYGPLPNTSAYEDLIIGFRAALEKRDVYLNEVLIQYRVDTGVSVKANAPRDFAQWRQMRLRQLNRQIAVFQQRLEDALEFGFEKSHPVYRLMLRQVFQRKARKDFHDLGFMKGNETARVKLAAAIFEFIRRFKRR
ncbi:MAG: glycosyltransferase [Pseudomonadota bacterium]